MKIGIVVISILAVMPLHGMNRALPLRENYNVRSLTHLDFSGQRFTNLNMQEIKNVLPQLKILNLSHNAITVLRQQHVVGMDADFYLNLSYNPIRSIDKNFLTGDIIRQAPRACINVIGSSLTDEQLKELVNRHGEWSKEAIIAAMATHGVLICTALVGLMDHAVRKKGERVGTSQAFAELALTLTTVALCTVYLKNLCSLPNNRAQQEYNAYWQEMVDNYLILKHRPDMHPYHCYKDPFLRHYWHVFKCMFAFFRFSPAP